VADMASVYLAILNGMDPTVTQSIDVIKKELKEKLNLITDLRKKVMNISKLRSNKEKL
jgi:hypothetical protein